MGRGDHLLEFILVTPLRGYIENFLLSIQSLTPWGQLSLILESSVKKKGCCRKGGRK